MGWPFDAAGWLWTAIWILALVVMVWVVVRGAGGRSTGEDALEILRARFARGEITEDEFERARARLLADPERESTTDQGRTTMSIRGSRRP